MGEAAHMIEKRLDPLDSSTQDLTPPKSLGGTLYLFCRQEWLREIAIVATGALAHPYNRDNGLVLVRRKRTEPGKRPLSYASVGWKPEEVRPTVCEVLSGWDARELSYSQKEGAPEKASIASMDDDYHYWKSPNLAVRVVRLAEDKESVEALFLCKCNDEELADRDRRSVPRGGTSRDVIAALGSMALKQFAKHIKKNKRNGLADDPAARSSATKFGFWRWDCRSDQIYWTPSHYEVYGRMAEDLPADGLSIASWAQCVHPDDQSRFTAFMRQEDNDEDSDEGTGEGSPTEQHGATRKTSFRVLRPDGHVSFVSSAAEIVWDELGSITELVGVSWLDEGQSRGSRKESIAGAKANCDDPTRPAVGDQLSSFSSASSSASTGATAESENRRKLDIISDSIHLGTWELDVARADLLWDHNLYHLFGYESQTSECPSKVYESTVPAEERERVFRETEEALQTHGELITRYKVITPAGKVRYVATRGVAFDSGDGNALKMHGVSWDVTVEETIRRETVRQQRELEAILASMYEGLVIHNASGEVVRFNKALLKLLGLSEEEVNSMPLSDPRWMGIKKDGERFTYEGHPIVMTLSSGKPQLNVLMGFDTAAVAGGGRRISWLSVTSTPIAKTNEDSTMHWVMTTFVDITELREAEQTLARRSKELEDEKRKFEGFVKALNQTALVSVMDATARLTFVNEKFVSYMRLLDGAEGVILLGSRHPLLLRNGSTASDDDSLQEGLSQALAKRQVWHGTVHTQGKRQEAEVWLDTTVVPIGGDMAQEPHQVYVLQIDVTDQKMLEKQLSESRKAERDANAAKSIFLATMSHEMRTPLNGVIGMCSLLAASELAEEHHHQVETITSCARALLSLIDHILDLSEIEASKMELCLTEIDLVAYLLELVRSQQYAADQKKIYLKMEIPEKSMTLYADHAKLGQVVRNLLSNAIKFTSEGGVTLNCTVRELRSDQVELRISVIDTGIGISKSGQKKLFQSFTQADRSVRQRFGGTGLGLSICKGLVALMGGQISLESEMGVGSTFSFNVILQKAVGASGTASSSSAAVDSLQPLFGSHHSSHMEPAGGMITPLPCAGKNCRVLVVEDNNVNQKVIGAMLKKLGVGYDIAGNGREALEALEKSTYSLVLMDCEMPVMDGYQATRCMRSHSTVALRSIPVIALTANAISGAEEECLRAGMNDYITKPITVQRLAMGLKKYLELHCTEKSQTDDLS